MCRMSFQFSSIYIFSDRMTVACLSLGFYGVLFSIVRNHKRDSEPLRMCSRNDFLADRSGR